MDKQSFSTNKQSFPSDKQGLSLDKVYYHQNTEQRIYEMWESGGYFAPEIDKNKKPYTIVLPLPNANDPMHMGHALFTVEDILIRYHRMLGQPTLWMPGGDHAGIETQFVFEKKLAKEGKSRFDFDRMTLYKMIADYVEQNKNINKDQLKRLGFSLDWTRYHYSLEPEIVARVLATFKKLYDDGLIYRGERIVNYCTHCGTAFSDLEVVYEEKQDFLYYLDYGSVQIATTRPETIFADVAVAVNPKDKRYKNLIGKKAVIPLINIEIPIISDDAIDVKFGTGALKVTPGYDPVDFEIGQRNKLETVIVINRQGRMIESTRVPKELVGLKINQARQQTVEMLKASGKLVKTEPLSHSVGTCYRCKTTIEPMVIPQWYLKTNYKFQITNFKLREKLGVNEASLSQMALLAVKKRLTKIVPGKRFEKLYFDWMENLKDWNISRQIVWGPRIPVWYKIEKDALNLWVDWIDNNKELRHGNVQNFLKEKIPLERILAGLQKTTTLSYQGMAAPEYIIWWKDNPNDKNTEYKETSRNIVGYLPETDTFDTWFLSGQWPVNTLKSKPGDFEYFYPTSVLDTLWDILFFWVGRMMMLGLYLTGDVPFKIVHIHSRVVDKSGKKMSKSKGNVLDPIDMVNKYGADALRMALVIGVAPASDIAISEEKIRGMRNFTNKIWNIGRFILMNLENKDIPCYREKMPGLTKEDRAILDGFDKLIVSVTDDLNNFHFGHASEDLYEFLWHEFADKYIESTKSRINQGDTTSLSVLRHVYLNCLKLLHPFMPYITEEVWGKFARLKNKPLIISSWPQV